MLTSAELALISQNPHRASFPLLATNPELVFLDSAATEQRPETVLDAQREFYETMNANPLRGLYQLSVAATSAVSDARAHIAQFIGAIDRAGKPCHNEIVFTRNTTESLNLLAHSLPNVVDLGPGDEVVLTIMEHHSNLIPWQRACERSGASLRFLRLDNDYHINDEELEKVIGPATKIVAVTQVSNVLGIEVDITRIAAAAHAVGALIVVDGAQSVPHIPVDVAKLGIDALAFSAHKLGGPMGIGVLWATSKLLDEMPPLLTGGEMIEYVSETHATWDAPPAKFEAGTQDAAGAYATDAAISFLTSIGMETVEHRERLLTRYLVDRLNELSFVSIVGPSDGGKHVGSVAFTLTDIHPHDVASLLDVQGICIRAGHHCAQPLLAWLGVGATCRASVALYNDRNDIDRLIDGLAQVWRIFHG